MKYATIAFRANDGSILISFIRGGHSKTNYIDYIDNAKGITFHDNEWRITNQEYLAVSHVFDKKTDAQRSLIIELFNI